MAPEPVADCLLYLLSILLLDGVAVTATVLVDFLCWDELVQDIVLVGCVVTVSLLLLLEP